MADELKYWKHADREGDLILCCVLSVNSVAFSLSLSLSFIPGSPRSVVDQLRTDACDELPGIGSWGGRRKVAVLCWAGDVGDEWQVTVASGRQSLGRRRAQTLSPRAG